MIATGVSTHRSTRALPAVGETTARVMAIEANRAGHDEVLGPSGGRFAVGTPPHDAQPTYRGRLPDEREAQ